MKKEIIYKKISDLMPYENNPRINDTAVDGVANSIKKFGFNVPIVIDKNNVIVAGHTRYKASKKLCIEEVPCIVVDDLSSEEVNAFRIADNKVTEASEWDLPKLDLELLNIESIDMSLFGFEKLIEESEKKDEKQKTLETMELNGFEHHDYLIFLFDDVHDWLNAVNAFGIKKVMAKYGTYKKVGVGRVLNGRRLLEKLGYKNTDIESWQVGVDKDN